VKIGDHIMKVLVLGANGSTGINVVSFLLKNEIDVKAIVRNEDRLNSIKKNENLEIIEASISDMDNNDLKQYIKDVDAVISCLGHNISVKGIFGKPFTLVVDAIKAVVIAINDIKSSNTKKIILMNTTACINKQQKEKFTAMERIVIRIMKMMLPPQRDNDKAIKYLIEEVGSENKSIEWIAVRPDTLINEEKVTEYTIHSSTIRSPIFNAGKTSRINVADFMVRLVKDDKLWSEWKYKTPVIYNV
jgi:putative NADH-flavin reductase